MRRARTCHECRRAVQVAGPEADLVVVARFLSVAKCGTKAPPWMVSAMLLTIGTTHRPATELGYLLAKHPDKCQTFSLAYGKAHVFYPEATEERCTAALLLDFDPVGL